jgi:hypothetical protein
MVKLIAIFFLDYVKEINLNLSLQMLLCTYGSKLSFLLPLIVTVTDPGNYWHIIKFQYLDECKHQETTQSS